MTPQELALVEHWQVAAITEKGSILMFGVTALGPDAATERAEMILGWTGTTGGYAEIAPLSRPPPRGTGYRQHLAEHGTRHEGCRFCARAETGDSLTD